MNRVEASVGNLVKQGWFLLGCSKRKELALRHFGAPRNRRIKFEYHRIIDKDSFLTKDDQHQKLFEAEPSSDSEAIATACRLYEQSVAAREQGDYAQAAALAQQALEIFQKEDGPNSPDVANVLNNLGGIHEDRAEYAEAEPLYRTRRHLREGAGDESNLQISANPPPISQLSAAPSPEITTSLFSTTFCELF